MTDRTRILWILIWLGFGAWGVVIAAGAWQRVGDYAALGTGARPFKLVGAPDAAAWRRAHWDVGAKGFHALADGDVVWRLSPGAGGAGGLALLSPREGLARGDWPLPPEAPLTPGGAVVAVARPDSGGVAFAYETAGPDGPALAAGIAGPAGWSRAPAPLPLPREARVVDAAWRDGALRLSATLPGRDGGASTYYAAVTIPVHGAPRVEPSPPPDPPPPGPARFGAPWRRLDSGVFRAASSGRVVRDDRYLLAADAMPGPGGAPGARPAIEAQPLGARYAVTRFGTLRASDARAVGAPRLLAGFVGPGQAVLHVVASTDARCPLAMEPDQLVIHPRRGGYWLTDVASGCYVALDATLRRVDDLAPAEVLARAGASPWVLRWVLAGLPMALALGLLLLWLVRARHAVHAGLAAGAVAYVVSASLLWRQLAPLWGVT